jgi:hypothetical protein
MCISYASRMMKSRSCGLFLLFCFVVFALEAVGAKAATAEDLIDISPLRTVTVPASDLHDEISCTIYSDFTVRIEGTDTPAPEDATIFPTLHPILKGSRLLSKVESLSDCSNPVVLSSIRIPTGGADLTNRFGNFIIFENTDPNGAGNFTVFNIKNGKTLFTDGIREGSSRDFRKISLDHNVLTMNYTAGVNATCSLMINGKNCWNAIMEKRGLSKGILTQPPLGVLCSNGYKALPTSLYNDDSVIFFDVNLSIDENGNSKVKVIGNLTCGALP